MLGRLTLTDFRNHAGLDLQPGPGFVCLYGQNGAGKTNVLEAVSMLAPGRGLRGSALGEMARSDGPGGWSVSASLAEPDATTLGTGTLPTAPERRIVRINSAAASVNSLAEWLAVLWLTPAMDRLFSGPAGDRRRFLDRLVLALEPGHAHHASRFEAAMRARNKLLAEPDGADPEWLSALEAGMAEHGEALGAARARTVAALAEQLAATPEDLFARPAIALDLADQDDLASRLRANRGRDAAAGRATEGPHRQDLLVTHADKRQPAARCSTGEQKALLLGLVLAHAALVTSRRGALPLLLLDEVAAHLDPGRRVALFERLAGRGQVWMTATEAALFDGTGDATMVHIG
ncbi:DNA replication and repair protein RecF [Sphingomonas kaistensis]|uniref:DNA replication and repair protein RecF n=1 Tax=Sphingomonas kaistensis TaxID=298708 RepID=A0A7X6BFG1_9SPHN|nr:DNA replication/repair protein RecF [Sphingomonas kaistensis]NJC04778.1 DNA replication and repair protein RecF [Sphingomonas kaistensis]